MEGLHTSDEPKSDTGVLSHVPARSKTRRGQHGVYQMTHDSPSALPHVYTGRVDNFKKKRAQVLLLEYEGDEYGVPEADSTWGKGQKCVHNRWVTHKRYKASSSSDDVEFASDTELTMTVSNGASLGRASPSPPPPPLTHITNATSRKTQALFREVDKATAGFVHGFLQPDISGNTSDIVEIVDDSKQDNIVVKVRVRSQMRRFEMKRNNSFYEIKKQIAGFEGVHESWILLTHQDITIPTHATPSTLKLSIADIIECLIADPCEETTSNEVVVPLNTRDQLTVKVQSNDKRGTTEFQICMWEPISKLMLDYAKSRGITLKWMRFEFDGEEMFGSETPNDLEMESGDCIDVVLKKFQ
ncbi:PREDICTED: NFATC2-interacting protein-like isoform X1 [Priapulus caudatus]|uniref:NFATC2-interacting protein-like isoform X1 n=1 Tax=Priapulus caudatus TaxID=37621 RepID=A0ABM1F2Y1_PRICU|nr:PREDICTED: NFATC2-interacting protein-like isoform X1 [Priapulus caudatus]